MGSGAAFDPNPCRQGGPLRPRALVCFSHLRWEFVWQRPQHLLTRFARDLDVYVVEEPGTWPPAARPGLRTSERDGVTILTPLLPSGAGLSGGFNDGANPLVRDLLTPFFRRRGLLAEGSTGVVAWYYTPMALGAEPAGLDRALVVYDAMDELASFRFAPAGLVEREARLLARADVVFAGGPSLYSARKDRHPRVHCFPSGVDAAHFARAADGSAVTRDAALAALPPPIVGFYGVLDERVDLGLVAAIADLRPSWTLALVGPLAKIGEADLPRRPNIVYPGKRDYAGLPSCLACFDAAILPFALNEATRFVSPTKTLEYLAACKPVVSTPIRDVVDLYGDVVEIAATPVAFVEAVERLWSEPPALRRTRQARAREIVAERGWCAIATRMRAVIDDALSAKATAPPRAATPAVAAFADPSREPTPVAATIGD